MRFNFNGQRDVPDWLLRECATLGRLSAVRVRLMAGQVAQSLINSDSDVSGGVDYGKTLNYVADLADKDAVESQQTQPQQQGVLSEAESSAKAVLACLRFIMFNSAKFSVAPDTLSAELQQLGLPKEHAEAITRPYTQKSDDIRASLATQTLRLERLDPEDPIAWRVDYIAFTSALEHVGEPVVQLRLKLKAADGGGAAASRDFSMECAGDTFRVLLAELKAARLAMES